MVSYRLWLLGVINVMLLFVTKKIDGWIEEDVWERVALFGSFVRRLEPLIGPDDGRHECSAALIASLMGY